MQKEKGKCDVAKHCAEFPSIGNHSPEQQVNQKWPYRECDAQVTSGNLSRIVNDGVMAGMVSNALLCDQGRPLKSDNKMLERYAAEKSK